PGLNGHHHPPHHAHHAHINGSGIGAPGRSPVSPAGPGDSPLSLSAGSQSTGTLTPSPLTPDGGNATVVGARPGPLKTALVSASS
ncbi:hypothetical protein FKP32DRAFT_1673524, partial [Trametes sanguinea]